MIDFFVAAQVNLTTQSLSVLTNLLRRRLRAMTFVLLIGLQMISCGGGRISLCTELTTVLLLIIY